MKKILIAVSMLMAATFATGTAATAAEKSFGLTIAGPNGYVQIGANGHGYGYGYDRYDYRDHVGHGHKRRHFHGRCLNRKQIRRHLKRQGWRGFHNLRTKRNAYVVNAWRRNGTEYRLRVDRCDGVILNAKRLGHDYGRSGYGRGYY